MLGCDTQCSSKSPVVLGCDTQCSSKSHIVLGCTTAIASPNFSMTVAAKSSVWLSRHTIHGVYQFCEDTLTIRTVVLWIFHS